MLLTRRRAGPTLERAHSHFRAKDATILYLCTVRAWRGTSRGVRASQKEHGYHQGTPHAPCLSLHTVTTTNGPLTPDYLAPPTAARTLQVVSGDAGGSASPNDKTYSGGGNAFGVFARDDPTGFCKYFSGINSNKDCQTLLDVLQVCTAGRDTHGPPLARVQHHWSALHAFKALMQKGGWVGRDPPAAAAHMLDCACEPRLPQGFATAPWRLP